MAHRIDVHDMVVRLREEARRMAPDSPERLLLREAASTIERLDEEVRRARSEAGRMTGDLAEGAP